MNRRRLLSLVAVLVALGMVAGCEHKVRPYQTVTAADVQDIIVAHAKKGEVVLLNLWATWCEPCRAEFPALVRIDEEYRDKGLVIIGLSVDEPEDVDTQVKPFVEEIGAKFQILVKAPGDPDRFMRQLHSNLSGGLPETILYARDGNPRLILRGEQTYARFREHVERSLR